MSDRLLPCPFCGNYELHVTEEEHPDEPYNAISEKYGIGKRGIYMIKNRKSWRNV